MSPDWTVCETEMQRYLSSALALGLGAFILDCAWPATGAAADQVRELMNSGVAHERLGQHQEAIADFNRALAQRSLTRSDRVRATFDRGVALDAQGRTKDAIGDYSTAIGLQPDFAPALNNRANAYRRLGKLTLARHDYLTALASNNTAREYAFYGLGQIAQTQGDADAARDYYRKALAANPSYALAAQGLASMAYISEPASYELHPPGAKHAPQPPAPQSAQAPPSPAAPVHLVPPTRARVARTEPGPGLRRAIEDIGPKRAGAPPRGQIQLGAFRDQASATEGWGKIADQAGELLRGYSPHIEAADIPGKGRFWRLRTDVSDKATAGKLCAALVARGLACIPVRD